jgi:hypothetical protein
MNLLNFVSQYPGEASCMSPFGICFTNYVNIMGKLDELCSLSDVMELEAGFFSVEANENEKDKPLKRSRVSQKK